jgi:hypothetical protein
MSKCELNLVENFLSSYYKFTLLGGGEMFVRKFYTVFERGIRAPKFVRSFQLHSCILSHLKFRCNTAISRKQFSYVNMLNDRKL